MRSIHQLFSPGPTFKFLMLRSLRSTETNPNTAEKTPRAAAAPVDVPAQVLAPRNLPTRPAKMASLTASKAKNSSCLCLLDCISSDQFYPLGCSNMWKNHHISVSWLNVPFKNDWPIQASIYRGFSWIFQPRLITGAQWFYFYLPCCYTSQLSMVFHPFNPHACWSIAAPW